MHYSGRTSSCSASPPYHTVVFVDSSSVCSSLDARHKSFTTIKETCIPAMSAKLQFNSSTRNLCIYILLKSSSLEVLVRICIVNERIYRSYLEPLHFPFLHSLIECFNSMYPSLVSFNFNRGDEMNGAQRQPLKLSCPKYIVVSLYPHRFT